MRHRLCVVVVVAIAALLNGCASVGVGGISPEGRSTARKVLVGFALASAALSVAGAIGGHTTESSLHDDVAAGSVTGKEFADRDATGLRWNRVMRASLFVSGLSLIGFGVLWEMDQGAAVQTREAGVASPSPIPAPRMLGR